MIFDAGSPFCVVVAADILDDLAARLAHILPSIPGYGFSSPPQAPMTPREVARLWHQLATEHLQLEHYAVQGGDWGSVIGAWLALEHPTGIAALHLNMIATQPQRGPGSAPLTTEEHAWIVAYRARLRGEDAYQKIQASKPQSLAFGLTDSPVGLAAWIVEKFHGWTVGNTACDPPFEMDWLIANVMLYWLAGPAPGSWLYTAGRNGFLFPEGGRVEVPTGMTLYPNDLLLPCPRSWAERMFDVRSLRHADSGGHFPALEQGPAFVSALHGFFRAYRRP